MVVVPEAVYILAQEQSAVPVRLALTGDLRLGVIPGAAAALPLFSPLQVPTSQVIP